MVLSMISSEHLNCGQTLGFLNSHTELQIKIFLYLSLDNPTPELRTNLITRQFHANLDVFTLFIGIFSFWTTCIMYVYIMKRLTSLQANT